MASLLMMGVGAVVNALAFSGSNYLFRKLSLSDKERIRHDLKIEKYQKDHNIWFEKRQEKKDAEERRRKAAQRSESHLQELDHSMLEYMKAWETENPEPQLYQYYHPSEDQKKKNYLSSVAAIATVGCVAYYVL